MLLEKKSTKAVRAPRKKPLSIQEAKKGENETCKQCDQSKTAREFPYDASTICLSCHRENAFRWEKLPWGESQRKLNLTLEERERRSRQAKLNRSRQHSLKVS